jgi:tRNA (guanine-N7-)-methyltransferase
MSDKREIKSYVIRTGRMTPGQTRALDELWPTYGLDPAGELLDWTAVFGRDAPCVLDIGFGNGDSLASMAAANPDKNYIGAEVHAPGVGHCLLLASKQALTNLKVVRQDAVELLKNSVADTSLARVNIFFPDPWHKKRHHKRRLVQPNFIKLLARKLQPNGMLHIVTDWPNYAEHIDAVISAHSDFEYLPAAPDDRVTTRFDNRGARLGHSNWERAWCTRSKIRADGK